MESIGNQPRLNIPDGTYVFVPMGIPAMGKSMFVSTFQSVSDELGASFTMICCDTIRARVIKEYIDEHGNEEDKETVYQKTGKKTNQIWFEEMENAVKPKSNISFVYLDKNHPPNGVKSTLAAIKRGNSDAHMIALVPECDKLYVDDVVYPMSLRLLVSCLLRVKDRENHETLYGSVNKRMSVVLMMFNLYRNVDFESVREHDLILFKLPFTDERFEIQDRDIELTIKNALKSINPGQMPSEDTTNSVISILETSNIQLASVDMSQNLLNELRRTIASN